MTETTEGNQRKEPNDKQMYSALSFCIMMVLVGVPLWWKTTEVYRVSLPYNEMDTLLSLNLQIEMNIHIVTLDSSQGDALIQKLQNFFRISKLYKLNFKKHSINKGVIGSCKSVEDIEKKIKHPLYEGSLQLFEVPGLSRFTPKNIVIGQNRTVYFSSSTDAVELYNFLISEILTEDSLLRTISHITVPMKTVSNFKTKVPPSDDFDILFTILNPEPEFLDIRLDISKSIKEYIQPFLRNWEDMNGFHVKSQWLYFITLKVEPKFLNTSDRGPHFALSEDLLSHVITPLEKKLASHVSKHPCLNFVLYIPPCRSSPVHIYTKKGYPVEGANAFISPRWGGIYIYNPDRNACTGNGKAVVEVDEHAVMTIFIKQLRLLLGMPELSANTAVMDSAVYVRLWEKDSVMRMKTVEHLTSAKLTLQSLSKLLGKISNIVINDQVGNAIYSALDYIYKTTDALKEGNLVVAYNNSKLAFLCSEKAFTDPSLLALLYFPDDQKYAVYIPLFLPIMIPILNSFKHIRMWIIKKINKGKKLKGE